MNGGLSQSFSYDAHDKLTGGTAGSETDGYDPDGSETTVSIYGATYRDAYDDEDRLVQANYPGGVVDTFTYNGLGLRVGKTDSTGTYAYLCDGTSPGAPVLSDGHAFYTPGLSENRGWAASYPAFDRLGNLWTQDMAGQSQGYYQDTSGFGGVTASGGGTASPFKFGGGNGCQTEGDTGLVLMGHRYYDARIGRFLTADPAGDGDNWYAYAGNDPVDEIDPDGLRWHFRDDPNHPAGQNGPNDTGGSIMYWEPDGPSGGSSGGGGTNAQSGNYPNALTGMFDQPYSPGEASFDAGLTHGIDTFTYGTFSGLGKAAATHNGATYAKAFVPFFLAGMSNVVGGGEASAARPLAGVAREELLKTISGSGDFFRELWGQNINGAKAALEMCPMYQA